MGASAKGPGTRTKPTKWVVDKFADITGWVVAATLLMAILVQTTTTILNTLRTVVFWTLLRWRRLTWKQKIWLIIIAMCCTSIT